MSGPSDRRFDLNLVEEAATPSPDNIWRPSFLSPTGPLTVGDSVMKNEMTAAVVVKNFLTPKDNKLLSKRSDELTVKDSLALSVQCAGSVSNMAQRLFARTCQVESLAAEVIRIMEMADTDMSCDTTKENASVVDSSVTDWKQDIGNSDDPGLPSCGVVMEVSNAVNPSKSSSHKVNEGVDPPKSEEVEHSRDQVGNSTSQKTSTVHDTRYFIIKSLNHQNIQLSIEKGIWATQVMNEPILEEAFHNSGKVILIFSVNMSGAFQGYAQMISSVGWRRDNVWSQGSSRSNPWGRSFKVKWLRLNDLPFQKTLHLKNPLNEYKPVKISRDCQELSPDVGEVLCELLDGTDDVHGLPNGIPMDDFPSKRPCIEPPCSLGEEEYNVGPMHLSWSQTPMMYPSFLYQQQAEANRYHLANQRSTGIILPEICLLFCCILH
ncbi:unnamed protein product [Malus baccata var. baccata]